MQEDISTNDAGLSPQAIEGRLVAHRKVLAIIVAELCRGDASGRWDDLLDGWREALDHQEDPGAVPSTEFAIEAAVALEMRRVAEAARRRLDDAG